MQQAAVDQRVVLIHFADILNILGLYLIAVFDLLAGIFFKRKFLSHLEINRIIRSCKKPPVPSYSIN
jgi:hypothetical protein